MYPAGGSVFGPRRIIHDFPFRTQASRLANPEELVVTGGLSFCCSPWSSFSSIVTAEYRSKSYHDFHRIRILAREISFHTFSLQVS